MVQGKDTANASINSFAKTICSICYEDLKPLIEDLQSISICGHVFHELCLQQWFEYCPKLKKRSCPICKQTCTNANVGRLYFQSVGDPYESCLSQKPRNYDENPQELQKEVDRLEGKALALGSALEQQHKEFKEVKDQLFSCKEQLKVEMALKDEALTQIATTKQLLRVKSEEQDRLTFERTRLQERNMALAKELAALKLASDVELEEDEITKLASLGTEVGSRESIDVLRKSLVIRNKSYKELMAKCNILGRGEAQCLRKLEKANEKIKRLKLRVQELETAVEIKENEDLRVLKDQDIKFKRDSDESKNQRPAKKMKLEKTSDIPDITFCSKMAEPCELLSRKSTIKSNVTGYNDDRNNLEKGGSIGNQDKSILCSSTYVQGLSSEKLRLRNDMSAGTPDCQVAFCDTQNEAKILNSGNKDGIPCSPSMRKYRKEDQAKKLPDIVDDELICYGDANSVQTSFHIRKATGSHVTSSHSGNHCFSGGLLGPDGTNWHLGKWCKKGQNNGSTGLSSRSQGLNVRSGDLIVVGADGRGGRIKVMRSLAPSSLDVNGNSSWAKKCKPGHKPNKLQPRGHLQIEHFFQRTDQ